MKAIVTLTIGEKCLSNWQRYCADDWRDYADKCGAELLTINGPLDESDRAKARGVAWQKCLLPKLLERYERIAIIDSDIAINLASPSVFDCCPAELIGGVISGSHIPDDLKDLLLSRLTNKPIERGIWEYDQAMYYVRNGLPAHDRIIQTGVVVLDTRRHADLFTEVYEGQHKETRCYEQLPLSHAIISAGLLHQLDPRFNSVLHETMLVHHYHLLAMTNGDAIMRDIVQSEFANNFFLHFAYGQSALLRFLPTSQP